jgi:hypothetical protein
VERKKEETTMQNRFRASMMAIVAVGAAVSVVISASIVWAQAQKPAASAPGAALKTPWGDPDLQGIWTEETDTPLQRPARFANQEYFTPEQRAELDEVRSALAGKDQRAERGTELDVGGSYNQLFVPRKHSGVRTSMIVDPPNGRIPPLTPENSRRRAGISPRFDSSDGQLQTPIPQLCRR